MSTKPYRCTPRGSVSMFADFIAFAASAPEFTRMGAVEKLEAKWDTVDGYVRVAADKGLIRSLHQVSLPKGGLETVYTWNHPARTTA